MRELICKYYWVWPKKVKNDPKFVRDFNSSLKLLTFQLSNVRELETIKYAFDYNSCKALYPYVCFDNLLMTIHIQIFNSL